MSLTGHTVIITGAAHGLGRAYATACAAAGANVTLADIDGAEAVAEEIRESGGECLALYTDVADERSTQRAAEATANRFGGIDGLINNAAVQAVVPLSRVGFEAIPDEEWDRVFRVNVKGTWYGCKAVAPYLRRRGGGAIVNVSSNVTVLGSPTRAHYVASKSAIVGLTRTLARELGPDFIRVNAIAPGSVLTEEQPTAHVLEMRSLFAKAQAMPAVLTPDDLVGAVVFLLSDASRFLTGQVIVVDAGASFT